MTMEQVIRRIAGDGKFSGTYQPAPGAFMEAIELLNEGADPDLVEESVWRLTRVAWMHRIGVTCPPWEWTSDHVDELIRRAPWTWGSKTEPTGLQLTLEDL